MNQNLIENELVILTKQTLDVFLKQENPSELISLYTFYYYTAKWQQTNQPKCTTEYVAKGLNWSIPKVRKIKKQLLEFGLIEDARIVDEKTKKVKGYYIKMNYIFKKDSLEKTQEKTQGLKKPPTGFQDAKARGQENEGVAKITPNALSTNNKNALSSNNKERKKENKPTFDNMIDNYTKNDELNAELKEHLKTRKAKKATLTNRAIELSLQKLSQLANTDNEKILIVQKAIENGWTTFYPLKSDEKPQAKSSYSIKDYEEMSQDQIIDKLYG